MTSERVTFLVVLLLLVARSIQFLCGTHDYGDYSPVYPYAGDPYPGQFPWFGVVYHRKRNHTIEYACGGTLIGPKHVLTARVCATNEEGSLLDSADVIVRMGIHEYDRPRKQKKISNEKWLRRMEKWKIKQENISLSRNNIITSILEKRFDVAKAQYRHVLKIHEPITFNSTSKNEIVILELSEKVKLNDYVQPICIQSRNHIVRPDTVFGWNAVDGETQLQEFQKKTKRCSYKTTNAHYNQAEICSKDRGSIGISVYKSRYFNIVDFWKVVGIVDCTSAPFVPCKEDPNFKVIALVQISAYRKWIEKVSNLDEDSEEDIDQDDDEQSENENIQKFKFQCGERTVNNTEEDTKIFQIDPYLGQWPWYGLVYHRKPNNTVEYACGGTLVSERLVITARICVTNANGTLLDSGDVLARFGTHIKNFLNIGYAQHRQVSNIHQPGESDRKRMNKIVLLQLKGKIKFNDYVQPICLGKSGEKKPQVVIGWGAAEGKEYLGQFNHKMKICLDGFKSWYYNVAGVCKKDRGSIGLNKKNDGWYLASIIDCTSLPIGSCNLINKSNKFNEVNYIKLDKYMPWIVKATNFDYLQIIREGQEFDKSKRYPKLLPRLNCGHSLARHNEDDPTAQLYRYPWIAAIFVSYRVRMLGTLISHRYVLTAADIFDDLETSFEKVMFVRFGCIEDLHNMRNRSGMPTRDHDIEYVVKHQKYVPTRELLDFSLYNVALIRTRKNVLFEDHIHPVCLPSTQNLQQLELSEYIIPDYLYFNRSYSLYKETIVQKVNCSIYNLSTNDGMLLCVDKSNKFVNQGGPVGQFVEYLGERFVQFGILWNSGIKAYTNLAFFMDWIVANMEA